MAHSVAKPSLSWVVGLGAGLAGASVLVLLAGPVRYRLGILPLRVALLTVLRWGAYGGIAAAAISLAYPDLQPLRLNLSPPRAFERALATVHEIGDGTWSPPMRRRDGSKRPTQPSGTASRTMWLSA